MTFASLSNVKEQERLHTGEKTFSCPDCEKRYTNSGNLNAHVKSVHSGLRPHVCTVCDKSFTQISSLELHKRIHGKEKLYNCTEC